MTNANMTPPPGNLTGISRPGRHQVIKPQHMKDTLKRLILLVRGHCRGLGWIMVLSALTSASAIVGPLIIGDIVTAISNGDPAATLILILAAFYLGDWFVRFLQQYFMAAIAQRIIHYIRTALFAKIKQLPLAFFDRRQHGELMSRLTNDIDNISTTLANSLTLLMTYAFTIVGILVIMLYLNPLLTVISLIGVGFIFLLTKTITARTGKLFAKQQHQLGILNGQIEETVSGLSVIKAFGRRDAVISEFEINNEELCRVATKALIWSGFLMPIMNVINNLCFVALTLASSFMVIRGLIAVGMISSFLLYVRQFTRPFVEIANIYNNFQTAVAGAERIFEIFDETPEPADRPQALPLLQPQGAVVFDHVEFSYEPGKPILRDLSFTIPVGTRTAIVGATGAGKTTIINLLTRFYDIDSGAILLDGHDLRDYKLADLRRAFGVVLQDTALFAATIKDNIAYGRPEVTAAEVSAAAIAAGADAFIRRLPQGYETVLTQGGGELSQGERQLLTIARAILINAPILILDEATSSVDTVTEQQIRQAVFRLSRGRTSFIIAHRLSTIRDSDVIIVIEQGRIIEQGDHTALMNNNGRYAEMYRTQCGEV